VSEGRNTRGEKTREIKFSVDSVNGDIGGDSGGRRAQGTTREIDRVGTWYWNNDV
jgi:hypothetical protein